MTKWRADIRWDMGIIIIVVFLSIAGIGVSNYRVEKEIIACQKTWIGRLYEQNPIMCENFLFLLFEDGNVSESNMKSGTSALLEFGYTQEGLDYLYAQSVQKQRLDMLLLVQMSLMCGIVICIWRLLQKQQKCMEKQMDIKITASATVAEKEIALAKQMAQRFVENIAHQIKTPLACISLSLDMIQETLQEETYRVQVKEAFVYLKQIEVLMRRLLDIGRLESGKQMLQKEEVSLEEVIHNCVRSLDTENKRMIVHVAKETEKLPVFYGDYDWLSEAFCNILKNALEHDVSKSKIEITLRYQKELIFIQIKNYGESILQEDMEYIFDRFYIPNHAKKGHTGIGLNLAKLVVEKHFGTIEAVNMEEGGVLFSICFPMYGLKNEKVCF